MTFEHDGLQFNYADIGAGAPVIFQHGLGSDRAAVAALLGTGLPLRLLSMDFRGHGQTPLGPVERLGFATFADDLIAFMDAAHLESAIVGGISMGAAVATNLALRYPHRVRGLILSRPCWLDRPAPPNSLIFLSIARFIRERGAVEGRLAFSCSPEYAALHEECPRAAETLLKLFDAPGIEQTAVKFERMVKDAPCDDLSVLKAIHMPTLILVNREDPVHPFAHGPILASAISGAELHEITSKTISESAHAADLRRLIAGFVTSCVKLSRASEIEL